MTFRTLKLAIVAASLATASVFTALPAAAQDVPKPEAIDVVTLPGLGSATILSWKVRFVSANPATRTVVLETPAGKRWAVVAPPLVGDLSAFRNGQSLLIRKLPGVVTAIAKPAKNEPAEVLNEVVVNDGLPGLPEGFGLREVTIVAPVVATDPAAGTVSFPGPDGYLRVLRAANATVLSALPTLQQGTNAKFTYVEGLAINAQ
ncbi:hypothetical protein V5F63_13355 [Xanthobacter autotrophicus DSM 597]|uniref:hypothetical protein n=1 Tax=Xanthobacter TaxID=279 RepID=UPI001AE8F9BF|nr:hypothetical protein [Xanthobacter flavus]MBP2151314.1 hypothetical protein [Xanthobacter flavus]